MPVYPHRCFLSDSFKDRPELPASVSQGQVQAVYLGDF